MKIKRKLFRIAITLLVAIVLVITFLLYRFVSDFSQFFNEALGL